MKKTIYTVAFIFTQEHEGHADPPGGADEERDRNPQRHHGGPEAKRLGAFHGTEEPHHHTG